MNWRRGTTRILILAAVAMLMAGIWEAARRGVAISGIQLDIEVGIHFVWLCGVFLMAVIVWAFLGFRLANKQARKKG